MQLWTDRHLKWNESEFGGISAVRFPLDRIWQPDITLYNAAETKDITETTLAVIYSSGMVSYIPPMILKSTCSLNLMYFPYDTQICNLKFGSWTYDGSKINLTTDKKEMDTSNYMPSHEWDLKDTEVKRNVKRYECCPAEPYITLDFTLHLARRGGLQALSFVAPLVFLAILCPVSFLLPYSETQRFSLGMCFSFIENCEKFDGR